MKWLFYIDVFNYCPAGNDGQLKVPAAVARSNRKLRELAASWKGNRRGAVYAMSDWTQAMCELSPARFGEYIAAHGTRVA